MKRAGLWLFILGTAALPVLLWAYWPRLHASWYSRAACDGCVEKYGQFGDSFGAVNALFTGMAFWAVVVTLLLQQRALAEQAREIEDGKRHQRATAEAMERQARALELAARLTCLTVLIERINRLVAETANPVTDAERNQRQGWFRERDELLARLREMDRAANG